MEFVAPIARVAGPPAVGAAMPSALPASGDGGRLAVGDFVRAQVASAEGNVVQLRFGELLGHWAAPPGDHPSDVVTWLRATVQDVATPAEARAAAVPEHAGQVPPEQADVRTRLAQLHHALAESGRPLDRATLPTVEHLQSAILAEQSLKAAPSGRAEQRFFAVSLPVVHDRHAGVVELSVRERDRREGGANEPARPDAARIVLDLPSLGGLRIALTVGGSRVSCQFATDSPFADALIRASSGDLVTGLERLGFREPNVESAHAPAEHTESPDDVAVHVAGRVHRVDMHA